MIPMKYYTPYYYANMRAWRAQQYSLEEYDVSVSILVVILGTCEVVYSNDVSLGILLFPCYVIRRDFPISTEKNYHMENEFDISASEEHTHIHTHIHT